jgi:hypothetical protein
LGRRRSFRPPREEPARYGAKYPETGKMDTIYDVKQKLAAIESDPTISAKLKWRRIHGLYAYLFPKKFEKQWKGSKADLEEARRYVRMKAEQWHAKAFGASS